MFGYLTYIGVVTFQLKKMLQNTRLDSKLKLESTTATWSNWVGETDDGFQPWLIGVACE